MKRDYAEYICEVCGKPFREPYPSLQSREPKAPSIEEINAIQESVMQSYKVHFNKEHSLKSLN